MKRLLLVLAAVTLAGASFAASSKSTFYYQFPTFYGVITNVSSVYFFTDDGSATPGAIEQTGLKVASIAELETCFQNAVNAFNNNLTITSSPSAYLPLNCEFAPTDVNKGSPSVTGYSNAASTPTDGEVIVITNDTSNWQVKGNVSSGSAPDFGNVLVAPAYINRDNTLVYKNSDRGSDSWITLDTLSNSQAFTNADAYTTNYYYVYAIPLVFKISIKQLTAPTTSSFEVTWDAADL